MSNVQFCVGLVYVEVKMKISHFHLGLFLGRGIGLGGGLGLDLGVGLVLGERLPWLEHHRNPIIDVDVAP